MSELITAQQAAAMLGIDETLVRRYCRVGRIKADKFGRAWMIAREDVEEFAQVPRKVGPKPKEKGD